MNSLWPHLKSDTNALVGVEPKRLRWCCAWFFHFIPHVHDQALMSAWPRSCIALPRSSFDEYMSTSIARPRSSFDECMSTILNPYYRIVWKFVYYFLWRLRIRTTKSTSASVTFWSLWISIDFFCITDFWNIKTWRSLHDYCDSFSKLYFLAKAF